MSIELRLRRGTTLEHQSFTGAEGEVTYDTDKKTIVVHDGTTIGGRAVEQPPQNKIISFYIDDVLVVDTDVISIMIPFDMTITKVMANVSVPPTGSDVIVDVNNNGTTIYTTQLNRPTIIDTANSTVAPLPDIVALSEGDVISIDIDQVGLTNAGENLSISIVCEVV